MEKATEKQEKSVFELIDEMYDLVKEAKERVSGQFEQGNQKIPFKDILSLKENEKIEISKGVFIVLSEKSKTRCLITCWMKQGSILLLHVHPDYSEFFKFLKGIVTETVSRVVFKKGDSKKFDKNVYHEFICSVDAKMIIECVLD